MNYQRIQQIVTKRKNVTNIRVTKFVLQWLSLCTLPSRDCHPAYLSSIPQDRRKESRFQQVFSAKCQLRLKTQLIIEKMIYNPARWQCKYYNSQ